MFQTLLTIGHFGLQTWSVFAVVAFLLSGFVLWRKGREEHYPEAQLFDGFLLSMVFGFIIGRAAYVGLHWANFGLDVLRWLDFVAYPGSQFVVGLIGSGWYFARFARQHKWDVFEVLDFWVIATTLGMAFRYIGSFFDGSMYGLATTLPWGLVFPQIQEKVHPIQLYFAIFSFGLFFYLSSVEYQYRSFEWYRFGKKTAQTGFLLANFVLWYSLFSMAMSFLRLPEFTVYGIALDFWFYVTGALIGAGVLWVRSGRQLLWWK